MSVFYSGLIMHCQWEFRELFKMNKNGSKLICRSCLSRRTIELPLTEFRGTKHIDGIVERWSISKTLNSPIN